MAISAVRAARCLRAAAFAAAWLGCLAARGDEPVSFGSHVAQILWNRCAACHRPGAVGPFSLLTYQDAAKRADFIAQVAASRRMPPWHAEPGYGEFLDDRHLSDAEIEILRAWAKSGAPQGNPRDLPPPPAFREGWQLGEPDLVLRLPQPFEVPAEGPDVFRCFVLPIHLDENHMLAGLEFQPGNPRVLHHALCFVDRSGRARQLDESDPGPGYSSFGGIRLIPNAMLGGWAPGGTPRLLDDTMGRFLRKGSDLVLQIHYHPSGKPETDQSRLGIYFAKPSAKRLVADLPIMNRDIHIPPGAGEHRVKAQFTLPVGIEAIGITPHMHYLGRQMKAVVHVPGRSAQPLVWVRDWDFNWQSQYLYKSPIPMPPGTRIEVEAVFDNSDDNPANPSHPPKWVNFGEQTTDEMCLCSVTFVIDNRKEYGLLMDEVVRMHAPFLQFQELFNRLGK